jgi:hypothetical protein
MLTDSQIQAAGLRGSWPRDMLLGRMPIRTIPGSPIKYGLICFDANAEERFDTDGSSGAMSQRLIEAAAGGDITNIFLFAHGWMGDVPSAVSQYDRWIRSFNSLPVDRENAARFFPGFQPLFIGLHWPSLPWGEEELGDGSFAPGEEAPGPDELYRLYLDRLGDTPAVRSALRSILEAARRNAAPDHLPAKTRDAFLELNQALNLGSEGVSGPPDADREPFDPEAAFENQGVAFGGLDVFGGILGLLRVCSYWNMKKRARTVGEGGMHAFVNGLQRASSERGVRIHLMGHSFGCIVISSILGGPRGVGPLERPIDSVVLAQGAVSLWSYASDIPIAGAGSGYFHKVIQSGKVRGPLVTTQSSHDTAVGRLYPMASAISAEISFAGEEFPKYGAIGTFGLQGLPGELKTDGRMLPATGEYEFERGKVYNLEASQFISKGTGSSGAHNDIDGPEVAHAIWQAAFASAS